MSALTGLNDGALTAIKGRFLEWWTRLKMLDSTNLKLTGLNLDSTCYWLCKWK